MKRTDFSSIVPGKGVRGMLLGYDEDRFFRTDTPIEGHTDFQLQSCDFSVTLEDNVLCVPKDGSQPFLDMEYFEDDTHEITRVQMSEEQSTNLLKGLEDPFTKVRFYLKVSVLKKLEAKAKKDGVSVDMYLNRLAEKES